MWGQIVLFFRALYPSIKIETVKEAYRQQPFEQPRPQGLLLVQNGGR